MPDPINYLTTDTELKTVADKIRLKTGGESSIEFPSGFVTEIDKLTDTRNSDATASNILSGKTAYVNGSKITGNISSKAAATYYPSTSDQSVSSGLYLSGAQTIKAVTTSNIDAANIKKGVVVKVGDGRSGHEGDIKNVTGTYTSDGTAAAGDIRTGKTAYVNGSKITGNLAELAATTYNTSGSDQTITASKILTGTQTIKAVTTENISASNIKAGVVIKVGDANNAARIANVTGTYLSNTAVYTPEVEKTYIAFSSATSIPNRSGTSTYITVTDHYNACVTHLNSVYGSGKYSIRQVQSSSVPRTHLYKPDDTEYNLDAYFYPIYGIGNRIGLYVYNHSGAAISILANSTIDISTIYFFYVYV